MSASQRSKSSIGGKRLKPPARKYPGTPLAYLENAPIGIYCTTPDGKIRYANRTLIVMLGFTSLKELVGRNLEKEGFEYTMGRRVFTELLKEHGEIHGLESNWVGKNGVEVHVRESARIIRNSRGTPIYYEGTAEEVRTGEKAEASSRLMGEHYQRIVENLREVVFQADVNGNWAYLNPAWKEITGFDVDSSLGKPFLDFVHPDDHQRVMDDFTRLLQRAIDYCRIEMRYVTKSGGYKWIEVYSRVILGEGGANIGTSGTLTDITERKHAQEALLDSEERYRKLVEISPDSVLVHEKGRLIYVNPAAMKLIGARTAKEIYDTPIMEFVHPDSRDVVTRRIALMSAEDKIAPTIEERFRRLNGTPVDVEVTAAPFVYGGRRVIQVIARDITERKRSEHALRQSEERYRSVVASLHEGIVLHDSSGVVIECNQSAERILGITRDKIIGQTASSLEWKTIRENGTQFPVTEHPSMVTLRTGKSHAGVVMGLRQHDGSLTWISINAEPLIDRGTGKLFAVVTTFTDTTKEREGKKILQYHADLLDRVSDAVISTDTHNCILSWNKSAEERYGWAKEEAIGKPVNELLGSHFKTVKREEVLPGAREKGVDDIELVHLNREGKPIDVSASIAIMKDEKGNPTGTVSVFRDISERMRMEAILRERDELFVKMFHHTTAVMILVDPLHGQIVDANPAAARFYGYPIEKLKRMTLFEINALSEESVKQLLAEAIREERDTFQVKHCLANGSVREVEIHANPLQSGDRPLLFSIVYDVTERNEAQRQLQSSLKEKEVLLKEVYHRVKNNLNVVAGLLSLQSRFVKSKEDAVLFEETKARIQAMGKVHQNLYQSDRLSAIDLREYLKDLVNSVSRSYGTPGVTTVLDIDPIEVGLDLAIPCGLIVNELISNCYKYAFLGRGSGKVTVTCHKSDESTISLSVSDDGIGLPDAVDFSGLKSLGLSLVTMLSEQIEAKLSIERKNGTTFMIVFPIEKS